MTMTLTSPPHMTAQPRSATGDPTPKPPPRYYMEGPAPSARPSRPAALQDDAPPIGNAIACVCASGGAGLSVCAAMLALTLAGRGVTCALVDADCASGGLDVLLGLEREPGMRMSDVEAPLGRLDGEALSRELPQWEGVRVLGADPWRDGTAQWWNVQAAVTALAQVHGAVVVDCGDGTPMESIPALRRAPALMVVELSVPGLARARALRGRLERMRGERSGERSGEQWVLGVYPRGVPRRKAGVDAAQAESYLGCPLAGVVEPRPALAAELLEGLGIREVPRAYRRVYDALAGQVETVIGHGTA